jgi:hypothetical protein
LALAFALAAALHVFAIGAFARLPKNAAPHGDTAPQIVTIAFRPKPTPVPTPKATPRPTPPPPVRSAANHVRRPAPIVAFRSRVAASAMHRASASASRHVGRIAEPVRRMPAASRVAAGPTQPSGSDALPGNGAGAGNGSGANGFGNGAGSGGDGAAAPCGVVVLNETSTRPLPNGGHAATIRIDVTMSDGSVVSDDLGWPFVYRRDVDDPFTDAGAAAHTPILLQLPPPGYSTATQKPATAFAVAHTDRDGYTDLKDCP